MSEELIKRLDAAMARIAALESERAARPAPGTPTVHGIDPRALIADPIGTMQRAGVPHDHITKVLVANALGDQAPPDLRMYAAMGPQVSATQALATDVQAVRQRLDQFDASNRQAAMRTSFSALAVDKVKYPLLAAAYAKNPALFKAAVDSHTGDAAALAAAEEDRLKTVAEAVGYIQPASSGNADTSQGQSSQTKQAQGGVLDTTPPPITQSKQGVFTQETHEQLRDRIVRKFEPQSAT